jgi:hypothetical protein
VPAHTQDLLAAAGPKDQEHDESDEDDEQDHEVRERLDREHVSHPSGFALAG